MQSKDFVFSIIILLYSNDADIILINVLLDKNKYQLLLKKICIWFQLIFGLVSQTTCGLMEDLWQAGKKTVLILMAVVSWKCLNYLIRNYFQGMRLNPCNHLSTIAYYMCQRGITYQWKLFNVLYQLAGMSVNQPWLFGHALTILIFRRW